PELAARYYHHCDEKLFLIGITGTSGKTTCTFLVKHLLDHLKMSCGLLGSIERFIGKQTLPSPINTPDLCTTHKLFYEMVQNGCIAATMEVSSHGLDQGRVKGIH